MTVADTVFDTINDNWGNGGYGGATPEINSTESKTDHDVTSTDVIEVRHYSMRELPKPVNDTYTNRYYFIDVLVSSKTSPAQLKLLYDEVEYLVRNTAMTDLQFVNVTKRYDISDWDYGVHAVILTFELVSLMSSGAITPASTTTGYNWLEANMIGSANAAYISCAYIGTSQPGKIKTDYHYLTNVDDTDQIITFELLTPTTKGSLKLYISEAKVGLRDADAGDYITALSVYGYTDQSTSTLVYTEGTDRTSPATVTYPIGATDMSTYLSVKVVLNLICTNATDIDISFVRMKCYYDI